MLRRWCQNPARERSTIELSGGEIQSDMTGILAQQHWENLKVKNSQTKKVNARKEPVF